MDFDVSERSSGGRGGGREGGAVGSAQLTVVVSSLAGHPEETSEQGSDRAAGADRRSLRVPEEGGGGADRPQGQDRECSRPQLASSVFYFFLLLL